MNPEGEKQSFINPESHKIIYQNEYDRMTDEYDAEYFAWAEDLYNSRIIVYSDKGKNLKNTDSIHSCGIIVEDLHSVSCVKCVMALVDTDTGDIYISDTSFNINWKMIRRSIEYGMELYVQDGGELNIETAKELVDVSRLDKKGYKASIVHGHIKLIKDDSDEKKEDENNGVLYTGDIGYLEDGLLYIEGRKNREVKINGRRIRLEHLEENWKKYFRSNMVCSFDDSKLYLLVEGKISEENVKKLREWIPILEKDIIAREVDKLPRKANGKVNVAFRA